MKGYEIDLLEKIWRLISYEKVSHASTTWKANNRKESSFSCENVDESSFRHIDAYGTEIPEGSWT